MQSCQISAMTLGVKLTQVPIKGIARQIKVCGKNTRPVNTALENYAVTYPLKCIQSL